MNIESIVLIFSVIILIVCYGLLKHAEHLLDKALDSLKEAKRIMEAKDE